jgi:signal transduction histidine kinase
MSPVPGPSRGDDEAIARFAARAAHDLNNLLTIIHGYGDLLVEDLEQQPDLRQAAQELLVAAQRVSDFSARMQALGREYRPSPEALRLGDFLAAQQPALAVRLEAGTLLECRVDGDELAAFASSEDLHQILSELVVNAAEAMPEGGRVTIIGHPCDAVTLPPELKPGRYCVLRVEDNGHGFAPDLLAVARQPFVTTKPRQQGAGLGLAIVDRAVRLLGGAMTLESGPGGGSVVEVYLPRLGA